MYYRSPKPLVVLYKSISIPRGEQKAVLKRETDNIKESNEADTLVTPPIKSAPTCRELSVAASRKADMLLKDSPKAPHRAALSLRDCR